MNEKVAFVFPGQGSQAVGMLSELAAEWPVVRSTFDEASNTLGNDLWTLVREGPKELLDHTENTQPAMLCAGVAVWRAWISAGGTEPGAMAGHSLGEFTALVCAGAIEFADAILLVSKRARFMREAVPQGVGSMAAILGLADAQVRDLCASAAGDQVLEAVNLNCPGQIVVAGHAKAVERALVLAKSAGAKRALQLPVSVPSHCALMRPAAERLAAQLSSVLISAPTIPVVHNVSADIAGGPEEIRHLLTRQLYSPVRWVETVQRLVAGGATTVVEAGPGKVLTGLVKRIDTELEALAVFDPKGLEAALEVTAHA